MRSTDTNRVAFIGVDADPLLHLYAVLAEKNAD
jgi:hypothetical protein